MQSAPPIYAKERAYFAAFSFQRFPHLAERCCFKLAHALLGQAKFHSEAFQSPRIFAQFTFLHDEPFTVVQRPKRRQQPLPQCFLVVVVLNGFSCLRAFILKRINPLSRPSSSVDCVGV